MSEFTHKYLDKFKKLEKKLKEIGGANADVTLFRDILKKAKSRNTILQHKEGIIWDLYGLRNVFAHADREKYIAEVNQLAFKTIDEILELLEDPPKVGDIFRKEVYKTSTDKITEIVLRKMQEKLYTHVPVYKHGKFIGVLTETTIMEWLIENIKKGKAQFYKQTVGQINPKYLRSPNNLFKFVSPDLSIFEVFKMFEEALGVGKRLGAIFITENGKKDGELIGIITAWDLPKIKEYMR